MLATDFAGLSPSCALLSQLPNGCTSLGLLHGREQNPHSSSVPAIPAGEGTPRDGKLLCVERKQPAVGRLQQPPDHHRHCSLCTDVIQQENINLGFLKQGCNSANKPSTDPFWERKDPASDLQLQASHIHHGKNFLNLVPSWLCPVTPVHLLSFL